MNLFLIEQVLSMEISAELKERVLTFIKSYNNILLINPENIALFNSPTGLKIQFKKENELLFLFFDEDLTKDGWSYFKHKKNFNDNLINIFNILDNIDSCAEFARYCERFYEIK